jgi:hypothetical protein
VTREEFLLKLEEIGCTHETVNGVTSIYFEGEIYLFFTGAEEIPPNIRFLNDGNLYGDDRWTKSPSRGIEFKNKGDVYLNSLTEISEDTKFMNEGDVFLNLVILDPDYKGTFDNEGDVYIKDIRDMKTPLNDIDSFKSLYPFFKNSGSVNIGDYSTSVEYRSWHDGWPADDGDTDPTESYIKLFDDLFLSVDNRLFELFEEEFWKSVRPVKMYESWLRSNF